MREILFKAKRIYNRDWVEGYPFPSVAGKELNRMTVFELFQSETVVNTYDVYPKTVCQYTGLTDKDGVKIFEGDILESEIFSDESETSIYYVFWNENGCFMSETKDYDGAECTLDSYFASISKVIGNIHDKED